MRAQNFARGSARCRTGVPSRSVKVGWGRGDVVSGSSVRGNGSEHSAHKLASSRLHQCLDRVGVVCAGEAFCGRLNALDDWNGEDVAADYGGGGGGTSEGEGMGGLVGACACTPSAYTSSISRAVATASSLVACAVWPSCQRNSAERRKGRVRSSQRTTLAHWFTCAHGDTRRSGECSWQLGVQWMRWNMVHAHFEGQVAM